MNLMDKVESVQREEGSETRRLALAMLNFLAMKVEFGGLYVKAQALKLLFVLKMYCTLKKQYQLFT